MRWLLRQGGRRFPVWTTDTPIGGVDEASLRVRGLFARVLGDPHLATDLQRPLSEGRWIDDRAGTTFHLRIDERRPLWRQPN